MKETKHIAVDTETTGISVWHGAKPFAFPMCNSKFDTYYRELPVSPSREVIIKPKKLQTVKAIVENPEIVKVYHHAKFDIRMLRSIGIHHAGEFHDTMIMARVANTNEEKLSLKWLANEYADISADDEESLKSLVRRCRLRAGKLGWKIGYEYKINKKGEEDKKPLVETDYWLPSTLKRLRPDIYDELGVDDSNLCEQYAITDAIRTMWLFLFYQRRLKADKTWDTYIEERDLIYHVMSMEDRGLCVCEPELVERRMEEEKRRDELYERIKQQSWDTINIDSYHDMRKLLYEKLQLPITKTTDRNQPSTDKHVLERNMNFNVIRDILSYRVAANSVGFFNNYTRKAVDDEHSNELVIHPYLDSIGARTTRFSCRDPNLQNVASGEHGTGVEPMRARSPFGPRPNYVWLCLDYKGQEIRIYASAADDEIMLRLFAEGQDVHSYMCQQVWGNDSEVGIENAIFVLQLRNDRPSTPEIEQFWKENDLTSCYSFPEKRRRRIAEKWLSSYDYNILEAELALGRSSTKHRGKMCTFGIIYGSGAPGLSRTLRSTEDYARSVIRMYRLKFPDMIEFMKSNSEFAQQNGFVYDLYGVRLAVDTRFAYKSTNYIIQGTAARMLKRAIVRIFAFIKASKRRAYPLLPIHDELIIEVHRNDLTYKFVRQLRSLMADTRVLKLPTPVDVSIVSDNWDNKRKLVV